jgi:hypothetical protein
MKLWALIVVVLTIVPLPQRRVALAVAPELCQQQQKKPASMTGFLNLMLNQTFTTHPAPAAGAARFLAAARLTLHLLYVVHHSNSK